MGSTRLSPEDLLPKSAPPPRDVPQREQHAAAAPKAELVRESSPDAQPARVVESTVAKSPSDPAQRARRGAKRSAPPAPRRQVPWMLIVSSAVLVACLAGFGYWHRTRSQVVDDDVNVVMPLVQSAPAEAEPVRTSIKVADRTSLTEAAEVPNTASKPSAQNVAANQTLVESTPSGAEIVVRGAVIANTPALLALPAFEDEYLLRKSGYSPELIRIAPNSPRQIKVELKAAAK